MSDKTPETPLSKEAIDALEKMKAGRILVGNEGDYGRDFLLMKKGAIERDSIRYADALALLNRGLIRATGSAGNQREYEPT